MKEVLIPVISGYVVVDFSGVQIVENVEHIPEFQKGAIDQFRGIFFYSLKALFKSIFDSEFRILKLDNLTVTIHPFDKFIIFLVLTDENYLSAIIAANELSQLCYKVFESKPKDKPLFFKAGELPHFKTDFNVIIKKVNTQFTSLLSSKELLDLANQLYSGVQFNDPEKVITLPLKTITSQKIQRSSSGPVLRAESKLGEYSVLQWTRDWQWKNFLGMDKTVITELSPEWKQVLAINAQLYLRSLSSEFQTIGLDDIKLLISTINNTVYKDLLYAKYLRFVKPGTYTKINLVYKEHSSTIEKILKNTDDDPEKQTLIFLLIDVTSKNLQEKLLEYFENNTLELWKGQCRETVFLIQNFRVPEKDQLQILMFKFRSLKRLIYVLQTSKRNQSEVSDLLNENFYRTLHELFFLGHHILIHPDLSYQDGHDILKTLYTTWADAQAFIKDSNKIFYSNKSKGLFAYFGYASLLPLVLHLGITKEPDITLDLTFIKREQIETLTYYVQNLENGHIELEMYHIIIAAAFSSLSCILNVLQEYSPDIPRLIAEYSTETYFIIASGLPYYHWALFYTEIINALLETALQLPVGPVRDTLLHKLTTNQQTFLLNTGIVAYTIIFWPAVFRLLTIYLQSKNQEMFDRAKTLVQKVLKTASPFWKEAFTTVFHNNDVDF